MHPPTIHLPPRHLIAVLFVFESIALSGVSVAQEHVYTLKGAGGYVGNRYGETVDGGADVNGDGQPDVITSGIENSNEGGVVRIHDALTGNLIREHTGPAGASYGFRLGLLGDLDGDGCSEYALSKGNPLGSLTVDVRSGVDGAIHSSYHLGDFWSSIERVPDMDGDQRPETLLGRTVHSIANATVLGALPSTLRRVTPAGDVDGNGVIDFCGVTAANEVVVHSLIPYGELRRFYSSVGFVANVRGIGDVNGDSHPDLAVRGSHDSSAVHSGVDGSLLYEAPGNFLVESLYIQRTIAPIGDVDGDCAPDFLLRSSPGALLLSGRDGSRLRIYSHPSIPYAMSVAGAGDIDGDGIVDVVMGCKHSFMPAQVGGGAVAVFRNQPPPGNRYCSSTVNSTGFAARITAWGSLSASTASLGLRAGPVPSGVPGRFFYGGVQAQTTFGNGILCIDRTSLPVVPLPLHTADSLGCLIHEVDWTTLPSFAPWAPGTTWHVQAWFRDAAAGGSDFNLSDAVTLSFVP